MEGVLEFLCVFLFIVYLFIFSIFYYYICTLKFTGSINIEWKLNIKIFVFIIKSCFIEEAKLYVYTV